jgi:hypothetical protein
MDHLATQIAEIIKDYRNESGVEINTKHVISWVSQFREEDREFLLSELLHILPKSYISKASVIEELNNIFEYLRNYNGYDSISDLLAHVKFLDCQGETKSQTKLLEFLNQILIKQFGLKLNDCGQKGIKHWIYLDDVLASGGTFKREISEKIDKYGLNKLNAQKITIIPIFFFLHTWGMNIVKWAFLQKFQLKLNFHYVHYIENDPRINSHNPSPCFNHVYPSEAIQNDNFNSYLDNINGDKHRDFAYRKLGRPLSENFYSSKGNRKRYEQIVLEKGLEILSKVENISPPIRPLGLSYPKYIMFGTGSHAFTWRNISNTCPLVYWWENHGWFPLFPVENRGNH